MTLYPLEFLPKGHVPYYEKKPSLYLQLEEFCSRYCPGISSEEMFKRIESGRKIEKLLAQQGGDETNEGAVGIESAVNLIWWFTAKAAYYGDLHLQGAFRLADGEVVFEFFKACAGEELYARISSHLNENIPKMLKKKGKEYARQYGFDVQGNILPSGKRAFLFAMQPDGSLYIKIEESGLPPIWQWKFFNFRNIITLFNHLVDYYNSHGRNDFGAGMRDCRDCQMLDFPERFFEVIKEVYSEESAADPLGGEYQQFIKTVKKGHRYGLSMMHKIITKELASHESNLKGLFVEDIEKILKRGRDRGYSGEIKGAEVPLPPVGYLMDLL